MAPPDENRALAALQNVQALPPDALDRLITEEIGDAMLGVFHALAKATSTSGEPDDVARRVHLMVLAWLMKRDVDEPHRRG